MVSGCYLRSCNFTSLRNPLSLRRVGRDSIAREIRLQADNGNAGNGYELADKAIEHGLKTGWLEVYDGMEDAYVMRRG